VVVHTACVLLLSQLSQTLIRSRVSWMNSIRALFCQFLGGNHSEKGCLFVGPFSMENLPRAQMRLFIDQLEKNFVERGWVLDCSIRSKQLGLDTISGPLRSYGFAVSPFMFGGAQAAEDMVALFQSMFAQAGSMMLGWIVPIYHYCCWQ
jgi:hypothetical protein